MSKLIIIILALFIAGCAGTSQKNAVGLAHSSFLEGDYQNTLKLIVEAEQEHKLTDELKAELVYLKAQAYDEMGERRKAEGLYEYLKAEHPNSQYGYLAGKMLESGN